MNSSWAPTPQDLDRHASRHVSYELRCLVRQAKSLRGTYPDLGSANDDALLEGWLVHLRVLDDFLGSGNQDDGARATRDSYPEAYARHWCGAWKPRRFLTSQPRVQINRQLAHLSGDRDDFVEWPIDELTDACCTRVAEFVDYVRLYAPDRLGAFREIEALLTEWADRP